MWQILQADALSIPLAASSVQCVVTSPPYWGLRDYGINPSIWGNADCSHKWGDKIPVTQKSGWDSFDFYRNETDRGHGSYSASKPSASKTGIMANETKATNQGAFCLNCHAWRGTLGLEPTPELFVEHIVAVFREVKRILRDDGTVFCNLGDTYQDKQLMGIPWMVAKALQAPHYNGRIKNAEDRAWLAAIVDGEGCMFIHRRKAGSSAYSYFQKRDGTEKEYFRTADTFGVGLEVSNVHREIVERCLAITGIGSICEQSPEANHRRKQRIYRWNVRTNECRGIIQEIYPHFVGKKHEARLVLGCPSSGDKATEAHKSLMALHNGNAATIDFSEPLSLYTPGWFLRSDIIWAKKNCMPESCADRPTKSHEYIFLLSKKPNYYFDQDAVREETGNEMSWDEYNQRTAPGATWPSGGLMNYAGAHKHDGGHAHPNGRNIRTVWEIATQPYPNAHFATFPEEIAIRCIKAGTSEKGACKECGAPWKRVSETTGSNWEERKAAGAPMRDGLNSSKGTPANRKGEIKSSTIGWERTCIVPDACELRSRPCIVLDPFSGAGTVPLVADKLNRHGIGLELKADYCTMAHKRCYDDAPLLTGNWQW